MASEERLSAVMPAELATEERQRDPFSWYAAMREVGPVVYDPDRDAYDVFHYDEVVEMTVEYERFGKKGTSFLDGAWMSRDPPVHTELRSMAENYFRSSYVNEQYGPAIQDRVDDLLDAALSGDDRVDFVEAVAKPLPVLIIADILGVPGDRMDQFREWSTNLIAAPEDQSAEAKRATFERMTDTIDALNDFFEREIESRLDDPQDDLITKFAQAEAEYDLVDRDNVVACCGMLLVAGNVTTVAYLTNAIWTFVEEDAVGRLQRGSLALEDALEEVLRLRSPVQPQKRIARTDTELGGVEIPEGARVNGWIGSANRDPRIFDAPDEFRPGRDYPEQPIPFGKGIHYCLGAPLANLEAEMLFSELLDRVDDVELATDRIEPYFSPEIFGPAELPLRLGT